MACSVLVVEDHEDSGEGYVRLLRRRGMAAFLARSATEARDALSQMAPDVILLDYHLGNDGDGLDVLQEVRADERWRSIPVVMMSASSQPERIRDEAMKLGARGWLEKGHGHVAEVMSVLEKLCPDAAAESGPEMN